MFCKYCGSEIADSSKFCDKCGKPVDTQAFSQTIPVSSTIPANKPPKKHKKIKFAVLGILLTVIIVISIPLIKINYSGITRGYSSSTTIEQIKTMEKFHFDTSLQPSNIIYSPNTDNQIFYLTYDNARLYNAKALGMVIVNNSNNQLESIYYFLTESEYEKLLAKHSEFSPKSSSHYSTDIISLLHTDSLNNYSRHYGLTTPDQPGYVIYIDFYD